MNILFGLRGHDLLLVVNQLQSLLEFMVKKLEVQRGARVEQV
jgi:hypothetical protein